ncbi:MAG: hypothetical protein V3T49_05510, partial [Dehalococcoidia bacterium]
MTINSGTQFGDVVGSVLGRTVNRCLIVVASIFARVKLRRLGHHPSVRSAEIHRTSTLPHGKILSIMIDPQASLTVEKNVQLAVGHSPETRSNIHLRHNSSLKLEAGVLLYEGIRIFGWGHAAVSIGSGTYLNPRTQVVAGADISIGENCAIAWDVQIISDD